MKKRLRTDYIVIHTSATPPGMDIGADTIRDWHKRQGWQDIGYHYVIRRDGTVELGRNVSLQGSHVKGYNYCSIGICLVGGVDASKRPEDNYTPEQKDALLTLLRGLKADYPKAEILGHRDLSPDLDGDGKIERHEWIKDCPCFDVRSWLSLAAPHMVEEVA